MDANLFRYIWQNSRREQLFVLMLIACSLPFYWMSLDIPKRIVNEALQGQAFKDGTTEARLFAFSLPFPDWLGGTLTISDGFLFDQIGYLFALSFLFLFFVVLNGAFKFGINISKGMLAERMLRRMRFQLFALLMRFKPEHIRTVKPAEAASMIKDEVEPIGGFIGDAFILPAFLGSQALTALLFIMVQSVWLGSVALAIVLIQAFLIPYLRREQLRLGRLRQLASRKLAGRIGEMVDGAPTLHAHGLRAFSEAEIGERLGELFDIRARLYKRKFAVKYLNNFLAQITPFFFYAIGGYLALTGSLDIGQLVAVIAAYRDLPPPIKELIDWDQRRADADIKYEQVISQFTGKPLLPDDADDANAASSATAIEDNAPIDIRDVTIIDQRGTTVLGPVTGQIAGGSHVAIQGSASSGRDRLAGILGRQIATYEGRVLLGDHELTDLSDRAYTSHVAYTPPDPVVFNQSLRENVTMALRRDRPPPGDTRELVWQEAKRTANPMIGTDGPWIDLAAAGVGEVSELDAQIIDLFRDFGFARDVFLFGLSGRLSPDTDEETKERLLAARQSVRAQIEAEGLAGLIAPFDFAQFNTEATIGENLMFGVIAGERLTAKARASDPYVQSILKAEGLERPLADIGLRIAETSVEIFAELPAGHPLFDRFSMVKSGDLEIYADLVTEARNVGPDELSQAAIDQLVSLAFDYIEPKHRLGLMSDGLSERLLRARRSFRRYLPGEYTSEIEFYDQSKVAMAAPIRDNLLFGRTSQGIANAQKNVRRILSGVLSDLGLDPLIYKIGLDYEAGPRGSALYAQQRAAISLARSLIRRPDVLILEDALKDYPATEAETTLSAIRSRCQHHTLIVTVDDGADVATFDQAIRFVGVRATFETAPTPKDAAGSPENGQAETAKARNEPKTALMGEA